MFEDGEVAAGNSVGDVAQFTPMLRMRNVDRRVIKKRKNILKRRKRNGTGK
jgi:hypothetical protein